MWCYLWLISHPGMTLTVAAGHGLATRRMRKLIALDKIRTSIDCCTNGHKRRILEKRFLRRSARLSNQLEDAQHKMAKWLCDNYSVILIPVFQTSTMVKRGSRKIGSETVRSKWPSHTHTHTHTLSLSLSLLRLPISFSFSVSIFSLLCRCLSSVRLSFIDELILTLEHRHVEPKALCL